MIRLIDFTCQINNFLFLFSISFFEIERIFDNGNVFFLKKHIKKKTIDIEIENHRYINTMRMIQIIARRGKNNDTLKINNLTTMYSIYL